MNMEFAMSIDWFAMIIRPTLVLVFMLTAMTGTDRKTRREQKKAERARMRKAAQNLKLSANQNNEIHGKQAA